MLRLASRLQTLRHYSVVKKPLPIGLAQESLQVFAPLANRLGIWQIKWELEDLSFRFTEPDTYRQVAQWLDEKRVEREIYIANTCASIVQGLKEQGIDAKVYGRPKHIYSIVKKMRDKGIGFERVLDIRAFRILVDTVPNCYAALSWVHSQYVPMVEEFNDYIARPKIKWLPVASHGGARCTAKSHRDSNQNAKHARPRGAWGCCALGL
jgi:GTP pyrophosphokinase